MLGKCPKCDAVVSRAIVSGLTLEGQNGAVSWNGLSYLCPFCATVLGVQMDPVTLKGDTVSEIAALLGKR